MEEKVMNLSYGPIRYLVHGKGPTLLFLHGGLATPRGYIPFIELLGSKYQIIAPTHPGHGDSFSLPNDWQFDSFLNVYSEMFDTLHLSSPVIVSHSLGGAIGFLLASKGFAHSIVAFDPMGLPITTTPSQYIRTLSREARIMFLGIKKRQQLRGMLSATGSILYSTIRHPENISWLQEFGPSIDVSKMLPNIHIPIALLWGENDAIVPVSLGHVMNMLLPQSTLSVFPGKGHTYIATDPIFAYKELEKVLVQTGYQ
jgi:pimeloyl-ACP methyl ester carboxylesterase